MLVTPDLRSEDISHLPKMICDFFLQIKTILELLKRNQEEDLHALY